MQFLQITSTSRRTPGREETDRIPCLVVWSDRRTMALQVKPDGQVVIRVPRQVSADRAMEFAGRNQEWILENRDRALQLEAQKPVYSEREIEHFKKQLRPVLEQRLAYFSEQMGVSYGRVCIRDQKTRWGSCSARGNLNFNWRLCLAPPEILDYVVVHELAHRKEMNHSRRFWDLVEKTLPDCRERRRWLRENGRRLG